MASIPGTNFSEHILYPNRQTQDTSVPAKIEDYDHMFKVQILGDIGTGKKCLINRFVHDTYVDTFISTLGADVLIKIIQIGEKKIKLLIWHLPNTVFTHYRLENAHISILVFDSTDRISFNNILQKYLPMAERFNTRSDPIKLLVATKLDLDTRTVDTRRDIDSEEAKKCANFHGMTYVETSAKANINVVKLFQRACELYLDKITPPDKQIESLSSSGQQQGWGCNIL